MSHNDKKDFWPGDRAVKGHVRRKREKVENNDCRRLRKTKNIVHLVKHMYFCKYVLSLTK